MDFNKTFIYFICIVSAMGGLLFGYDWVVIGGAKPFYEVYFGIADSPSQQGLAMSIARAGCRLVECAHGVAMDVLECSFPGRRVFAVCLLHSRKSPLVGHEGAYRPCN